MVFGLELSPGQAAPLYSHPWRKGGDHDCWHTPTAAPGDALLANGVMAHADEMHISHNTSRSHSGGLVVLRPLRFVMTLPSEARSSFSVRRILALTLAVAVMATETTRNSAT